MFKIPNNSSDVATNTSSLAGKANIAQESWIAPTLENSWVNTTGLGLQDARYMKDSLGMVHIQGSVTAGSANTTVFTLPEGYRPAAALTWASIGKTATDVVIRASISSTGGFKLQATETFVSIQVSFRAGA